MVEMNKVMVILATAGLLAGGSAQSALYDRGGGLLYDDVLKVTWLQDANYSKTSGYDSDGLMDWSAANTRASSLNISRAAGESLSGWRLASNTPVGANWNFDLSFDGSADVGWNITSTHSELGYMYYINLGLKGTFSPEGVYQADSGVLGNATWGGQANVGLVKNLDSTGGYWSGTVCAPHPCPADRAWGFGLGGFQRDYSQSDNLYAWAVRPGDVPLVPEPETYAMLLAGLALMGTVSRRRRGIAAFQVRQFAVRNADF